MADCSSADSIVEAAALIKANGEKIDKFTNGASDETVQLGTGTPTPTLRKLVQDVFDSDALVHKEGTETITGAKTFTAEITGDLNGTATMAVADSEGHDIVQTYANKNILNLANPKNWEQYGLYPHEALSGADYTIMASQGFCYDPVRDRFIVAMISSQNEHQELHAFAYGDFSEPVLVSAHTDLGHANSLAYCSETDEIVCMTNLSGAGSRQIGIIDPETLETKKILLVSLSDWPHDVHIAYDLEEHKFVMSRRYAVPGDVYETKEHVWICSPVVANGSIDGFSVDKDFFLDIGLVNGGSAGQNNGLGANGGMFLFGGNYIGVADYKKEKFYGFGFVNPDIAEIEDFCFAKGSWFVNINKVFGVFRCGLINAKYSLADYSHVSTHGGTVYGSLSFPSSGTMPAVKSMYPNSTGAVRFWGGSSAKDGANLILVGKNLGDSSDGCFFLRVYNGDDSINFIGKPNGSLTWNGEDVTGDMHLAGEETVSGAKTFNEDCLVLKSTAGHSSTRTSGDTVALRFWGGKTEAKSAKLILAPTDFSSSTDAGTFKLSATDGTNNIFLQGTNSGTLKWNGQTVQTSSDERLKTPLSTVPDAVLDAWEAVQWGQYQYLDAVERKGEAARLHLGLVAQRVKAVFEDRGLDACEYGILCHEEQPATEDDPAQDLWMVRYEEALAMEAACLRRRIAKLEAKIG